jgi:hypothetical protein
MKEARHFFILRGLEQPKIVLFENNFNMNFDGRDVDESVQYKLVMKGKCIS